MMCLKEVAGRHDGCKRSLMSEGTTKLKHIGESAGNWSRKFWKQACLPVESQDQIVVHLLNIFGQLNRNIHDIGRFNFAR